MGKKKETRRVSRGENQNTATSPNVYIYISPLSVPCAGERLSPAASPIFKAVGTKSKRERVYIDRPPGILTIVASKRQIAIVALTFSGLPRRCITLRRKKGEAVALSLSFPQKIGSSDNGRV